MMGSVGCPDPARRQASIEAAALTSCLAVGLAVLLLASRFPELTQEEPRKTPGIAIELVSSFAPVAPPAAAQEELPKAVSPRQATHTRILAAAQSPEQMVIKEPPKAEPRKEIEKPREEAENKKTVEKPPAAKPKPPADKPKPHATKPKPQQRRKEAPPPKESEIQSRTLEQKGPQPVRDAGQMTGGDAKLSATARQQGGAGQGADHSARDLALKALIERIEGKKRYPPAARRVGAEGTVELAFVIDGSGAITGAYVETPSGHRSLDIAASRIADELKGARLGVNGEQLRVTVPVRYALK
ncbi:MAG: TonB family protein [Succinivibrio sp.]